LKKKLISISHPTSNPNSRNAALSISEANLLYEVITSIGYNSNSVLLKYSPDYIKNIISNLLSGRAWNIPKNSKLTLYPLYELIRIFVKKTKFPFVSSKFKDADFLFSLIDKYVANYHLDNIDAIYAYEDCAASTFDSAKKKGIKCFYDLPIPHYKIVKTIQNEECDNFPEFKESLKALNEPKLKIDRKIQELELADHIFVASNITKKSLISDGIDKDKITVIGYGSPVEYFFPKPKNDNVFRVLYVGRVTPLKGIHYLLKAWQELNLPNSELVLVGKNDYPNGWLDNNSVNVKIIGHVPHKLLNDLYTNTTIFISPSLLDGFGLTIFEAFACGIPVITTENTGASEFITEGVDGFIIPIRSVTSIKEKLEWCYQNPNELKQMTINARENAETHNWKKYRNLLSNKLTELL